MTKQSLFNAKSPALRSGLFCVLLLMGCTRADNPDDVTIEFWTALTENNLEKAASYSTEESARFFNEKLRNASLQVGKTHYDCDGATVDTYISLQSTATSSSFKTFLIRDDDEDRWKVDYRRTLYAIDKVSDKSFKNIITTTKETSKTAKSTGWAFLKELGHSIVTVFKEMKRRLLS